jgi:hypothetical protein
VGPPCCRRASQLLSITSGIAGDDLSADRGYKDAIQVRETGSRRMTDAQIPERWRTTGSQIRSRLLFSCNSSESRGNIAFLHFLIPEPAKASLIKVDGRNPASRIGQRRPKLALVTRTVGLAASSVGFVLITYTTSKTA